MREVKDSENKTLLATSREAFSTSSKSGLDQTTCKCEVPSHPAVETKTDTLGFNKCPCWADYKELKKTASKNTSSKAFLPEREAHESPDGEGARWAACSQIETTCPLGLYLRSSSSILHSPCSFLPDLSQVQHPLCKQKVSWLPPSELLLWGVALGKNSLSKCLVLVTLLSQCATRPCL